MKLLELDRELDARPAYEVAAEKLRRALDIGLLLPGEPLPSERELAAQWAVSRVTVRQAVRQLKDEQRLDERPSGWGGPRVPTCEGTIPVRVGGFYIQPPVEIRLRRLCESKDVLLATCQMQQIAEGLAARLSAIRQEPSDLALIEQGMSEHSRVLAQGSGDGITMDRLMRLKQADASFHLAIARAAGDGPLFELVADLRQRFFAAVEGVHAAPCADTTNQHWRLVSAIRARKPLGSSRLAETHLRLAQRRLEDLIQAWENGSWRRLSQEVAVLRNESKGRVPLDSAFAASPTTSRALRRRSRASRAASAAGTAGEVIR
jgi:DNA-binding FadR family transcriptional regulator